MKNKKDMKKEKKPIKEYNQIKKWLTKHYGEPCYKNGRIAIGCMTCQVWQAMEVLGQALEILGEFKTKK